MIPDDNQHKALIQRWFAGNESAEDAYQLHLLLKDNDQLPVLISALEQEYDALPGSNYPDEKVRSILRKGIAANGEPAKEKLRFLGKWRVAVAAAVLLLGAVTWWWTSYQHPGTKPVVIAQDTTIQPGKSGAMLTLADGSQVSLDTIQNGTVALQGGVTARVTNGVLTYEGQGAEVLYNTISTAKGRQYHITLPDGSGIWLNAASSIRYPTSFSGTERHVTITGEVYFEIAGDARRPFKVDVNGKAVVQVLGTDFNINAYENEPHVITTLLQGSVMTQSALAPPVRLSAGQQALIANNASGEVTVLNNADIEKVMAWKNGLFNFNGASLAEVMKQLERWYDIEVIYEKGVPQRKLMGKMTKDISLEGLLVGLKELGINCRLEGRKLIVSP